MIGFRSKRRQNSLNVLHLKGSLGHRLASEAPIHRHRLGEVARLVDVPPR